MSYSSVTVSPKTPFEHRDLVDFCEARNLQYLEEYTINLGILDDSYKKPTKALKTFCGPENANRKGHIQAKAVVELILRTARRLGLDKAGGIIELNDNLRDALSTTESSILLSSLPSRVNALLTDA
jgi:hypothetical protein